MEIKTPKVTLLTWTANPLETVYSVWKASKDEEPLMTTEEVRSSVAPEEVRELFRAVIQQRIPVGEHVDFVFMLENVSVSWREQAVRHRIGTTPSPERLGIDMGGVDVRQIPDLADSTFWSQSMRIQNMGQFADQGNYRVPETLLKHPQKELLLERYRGTMAEIQRTYNDLVAAGIPMEDARELIPLGAQHRISWRLNISSLQHIVGKRGCWILQLGIWGPIIQGMISELAAKVDPIFTELVSPPCVKGDEFSGCVYQEENRRRYTGDDAHPPCPLHVRHHFGTDEPCRRPFGAHEDVQLEELEGAGVPMAAELLERAEDYRKFWGRNVWTGRRLPVVK